MPEATASIASSGTVRKTTSTRSATSCGAQTRAPGTRFASACAEATLRLARATTSTPARANPDASPVPTRPAPTKPSLSFSACICYQLYDVAPGRQAGSFGRGVNACGAPALLSHVRSNGHVHSTLNEVPNEKPDRSNHRRSVRHDGVQRDRADAESHSGNTRASRDTGDTGAESHAREAGHLQGEGRQRQEKGQGQSQELKPHRPTGRAGPERRDFPPFCFCRYNRGPDPIRALLKSPHDDPTLPLASLSTRRPKP